MQSQHNHRPLLNHWAAAASAVLPRQDVVSRPPQPLWLAITKLVILEFFVVAGGGHLAGVIYHQAGVGGGGKCPPFIPPPLSLPGGGGLISPPFLSLKKTQPPARA